MINLKIKHVSSTFDIYPGSVFELVVENKALYYQIGKSFISLTEDDISLFDSKSLDNGKNIVTISDLWSIDSNNKKTLSATYKSISTLSLSSEVKDLLAEIDAKIINVMDIVAMNFDTSVSYEAGIDLPSLLEICKLHYDFDSCSFISAFVSYIKAIELAQKHHLIIVFGIADLLSESDFLLLKKELEYLDLSLLNFSAKKSILSFDETVIIDNDLCEI